MMEYWNIGIMVKTRRNIKNTKIFLTKYSNIP